MIELKPCAYCGSDAFEPKPRHGITYIPRVTCSNTGSCALSGRYFTYEKWNTRASDKRIEQLENELEKVKKQRAVVHGCFEQEKEINCQLEKEKDYWKGVADSLYSKIKQEQLKDK